MISIDEQYAFAHQFTHDKKHSEIAKAILASLERLKAIDAVQMKGMLDNQQTIVDTLGEKKEWVGLTDEELLELSKDAWGRDKLHIGRSDHTGFYIDFGQLIEAKLKEKNNAS